MSKDANVKFSIDELHALRDKIDDALGDAAWAERDEPPLPLSNETVIDVATSCDTCLCSFIQRWHGETPTKARCLHPVYEEDGRLITGTDLANFSTSIPDWCPLGTAPVLLMIKKRTAS